MEVPGRNRTNKQRADLTLASRSGLGENNGIRTFLKLRLTSAFKIKASCSLAHLNIFLKENFLLAKYNSIFKIHFCGSKLYINYKKKFYC